MPTTLNTNQDALLVLRPDAWRLWWSEPWVAVDPDPNPGSVRVTVGRYVAAGAAHASSVVAITGTGLGPLA